MNHVNTELFTRPQTPEPLRRSDGNIQVYESRALFGHDHEIGIEHAGSFYRLRITRQGKLILNK